MLKNLFRKNTKPDPAVELANWIKEGKPFPPPHIVKQQTIEEYRLKYNIQILVETGTYLGDMVEAQKDKFRTLYSIELSDRLYKKARQRFKGKENIVLLQGDSGVKIAEVINMITQPALFWLDGHYSGGITALGEKECPVPEELHSIFKSPLRHIILIDDARLFNGTNDYPTIETIQDIIQQYYKNYSVESKDDIIRLISNFN